MPPPVAPAETYYLAEQRGFRRLEVSLPVWLAEAARLELPGAVDWSLGYTRDVSVGGARVVVPRSEQKRWAQLARDDGACIVRFDLEAGSDYITGRIRRAAYDAESGHFWLGVQYEPGAEQAKAAAVRAGLRTMHQRHRWQAAFVVALLAIAVAGMSINRLRQQSWAQQARIAQLQQEVQQEQRHLTLLSTPGQVATRATGIDTSFQRKEVQQHLRQLEADVARLSSPNNQAAGEMERERQRQAEGIQISSAPAAGVNLNLGIALPYGYAWPQVTSDLEEMIGRSVPTVVIFRDFAAPFPLVDCREAKVRAKTLQITWEPWHFSDPAAIKLQDIVAGKHDKYIDDWASAAKSFGSELWLRWGHEFNGNWYPWATAANNRDVGLYVAAYRHVRARFRQVGASNVRWIWCLNAETVPNETWNDPLRAYPGDNDVDMIAIDGYNFGATLAHSRWESFHDLFAIPYARVTRAFPLKPVMIGEVGCATVGGDKAAWITAMDADLRRSFGRIEALIWFEAQKEADWRMESTPATLAACRKIWSQPYYRRGEA